MAIKAIVTFHCDGPGCRVLETQPLKIHWIGIPQIIVEKVGTIQGPVHFCSVACLMKFMRDFRKPQITLPEGRG